MQGDATASPFRCLLAETTYRERHQSVKSWGCGGKAPAGCADHKTFLLRHGRPLIMHSPDRRCKTCLLWGPRGWGTQRSVVEILSPAEASWAWESAPCPSLATGATVCRPRRGLPAVRNGNWVAGDKDSTNGRVVDYPFRIQCSVQCVHRPECANCEAIE